jgi:hypothetical protein
MPERVVRNEAQTHINWLENQVPYLLDYAHKNLSLVWAALLGYRGPSPPIYPNWAPNVPSLAGRSHRTADWGKLGRGQNPQPQQPSRAPPSLAKRKTTLRTTDAAAAFARGPVSSQTLKRRDKLQIPQQPSPEPVLWLGSLVLVLA